MSDDAIAAIVFGSGAALILGVLALYWRQRLLFTRGADPVVSCSVRWWNGPLGLGWRQGFAKLGKEQLVWRRRLTFRTQPQLVLERSRVTLIARRRPDWQSWWWISSYDVLTLDAPSRRLDLGVQPDDAELVLDWLGTPAERPAANIHRGVSAVAVVVWVAAMVLFWGSKSASPWVVPGILVAYAAVVFVGGALYGLFRRRRLASRALDDEFVNEATDVFGFLRDFGFDDAYVQHFPWETTVLFTGGAARIVAVKLDRRGERLDLAYGLRSDESLRRLRDVLEAEHHPNPDRVTSFAGADGPIRKALEANSHALRLWGRPFLTGGVADASTPGA